MKQRVEDVSIRQNKGLSFLSRLKSMKELTVLIAIVVLVVGVSLRNVVFLSESNLKTTALGLSTTGLVGIGVTMILISGCTDLSVGSILGLSSVLTVVFANAGLNVWLSILITLLISACIGFANGVMVGKYKFNAFITTYAVSEIVRGIVLVLTKGYSVAFSGNTNVGTFRKIGTTELFGKVPLIVLLFVIITIIFSFLLKKSAKLRKIFYVGSNEKAAMLSGINSLKVKISLYMVSALFASLAGILVLSRFGSATSTNGDGIQMEVLSAAVIGGTTLAGGRGTIFGTVLGVIMMSIVKNAMVLFNISVNWQNFVSGTILILAIVLDYVSNKRRKKEK